MEFIHKFVLISVGIFLAIVVIISITVAYKRSVSAETRRKREYDILNRYQPINCSTSVIIKEWINKRKILTFQ